MNHTHLILFILFFCATNVLIGQDTIQTKDVEPYSYSFTIHNGEMRGEGATVLKKAISESHLVMLGNNSRSKQEAELDYSLLHTLNRNEYKTMILEIGTASGEVLNGLLEKPTESTAKLKTLNQKYAWLLDNKLYAPIPELKNTAAAKLVEHASDNNWSFLALGTDSWTSFKMLTDHLYSNLSENSQAIHKQLYQRSIDLIDSLYPKVSSQNYSDIMDLTSALKNAEVYTDFLNAMSEYAANETIVQSIHSSLDYWWMYGNREFYKKNEWNSQHNKVQLKKALKANDFDFRSDKLFLKMWRGHLSKSVTPNGFHGVGNMLSTLADYHGHQSLCIAVMRRFYTKGDQVVDMLEPTDSYINRNKIFLNLGQQEEWTVIDLRPFNKEFYWGPYELDTNFMAVMRNYDMIIIPKTEEEAEINY